MTASLAPERVHRTRLSNGLTLLVHEDRSAPVVAIVTYVKAGYFDEGDDVVGIAHVLEHMYFKGTPTRGVGEIAKQTKASGGYLNAGTIYDHTSYYTVLPSAGLREGLAIQADAYANSSIDAEELRRELEVIIEEARRKEDTQGAVATESLFALLHDAHRMRRWRIGREDGLRGLRREHVHGFYRTFYRPSRTILAIAGDVDVDALVPMVERLYGALPDAPVPQDHGPVESAPPGRRYREIAGDVTETHWALGWRTPGTSHDDTPHLDLAAGVLSSGRAARLYRAVRERRLAAGISAYNYTPTDLGVFVVHAHGPAATAVEGARAAWREVARLRDHGVAPADLERARRLFEARWLRRLETMEGQANYLAEWEALGDWRLGDAYADRMRSASADEVVRATRRWLDPQQAAFLLSRPRGAPVVAAAADDAFAQLDAGHVAPLAPPVLPPPVAPARAAAPVVERVHGRVSVYRTPNGLPILVRRKPGAPIVHVGYYALGGAAAEPAAQAGLATLLARVAVKGTARRDAERLALESELLGGSLAPSATSDAIGWTLSVPPRHLATAIDLLADVVLEPAVPDEALDTERAVARAQLAQLRDDMSRYPVRLATAAAFEGHAYGRGLLGDEATLAAITRDALLAWHAARVRRASGVLAVVGDVDPDAVAALLAAAFPSIVDVPYAAPAPPAWPTGVVTRVEARDKAQTGLAIAFPGAGRRDAGRLAAHLIAGVASGLGGRFFDELRDRQSLCYTVQAAPAERLAAGMFLAYIGTSPDKESRARDGLLHEFARLCDDGVRGDELQRARTYALGTHAIAQQEGGHLLAELVDAWLMGDGLEELDTFEARLRALSAADLRAFARAHFDPARRVEGIVRGSGAPDR